MQVIRMLAFLFLLYKSEIMRIYHNSNYFSFANHKNIGFGLGASNFYVRHTFDKKSINIILL